MKLAHTGAEEVKHVLYTKGRKDARKCESDIIHEKVIVGRVSSARPLRSPD